jgi:topoisomerase-4 subunit B
VSKFENGGHIVQASTATGPTNRTGTCVCFKADPLIFKTAVFNPTTIKERIRESAFLYKGVKIIFIDETTGENITYESKDGISEFVSFINDGKSSIGKVVSFTGTCDKIEVEVAIQYTTSSNEIIVSFANSVKTREGGSHESGFKFALTECINNAARN